MTESESNKTLEEGHYKSSINKYEREEAMKTNIH